MIPTPMQKQTPACAGRTSKRAFAALNVPVLLSAALLSFAGCASPGAPRPPSLHLPRPVGDLQAQRVGNAVRLSWTMPEETTDKQGLAGPQKVTACRRAGAGVCAPVQSVAETPSAKVAIADALPQALTMGSPELLTYEIEVLNATGRSAGASNLAYTASGVKPALISGLKAAVIEKGVVLSWLQAPDVSVNDGTEILVRRERVQAAAVAKENAAKKSTGQKNPLAPQSAPDVQMLRVHSDAGGTLDASVVFGEKYAYTVQRVEKLVLAGQTVEVRSEPSEVVNVDVRDVFPPQPPQGLASSDPVHKADGSYAVDLSWEANAEPDLAGYFIYRRDASAQTPIARVNAQFLPDPAFHDASIVAGHTYVYSVTAVDKNGNESKQSVERLVEISQ